MARPISEFDTSINREIDRAFILWFHMTDLGESAFPSQSMIAKEAGMSLSTVYKALAGLEKKGWILQARSQLTLP